MATAAIIILAGTETPAGTGRAVNGLEAAKEFVETEGDSVELIFDGAGTQWIPALEAESHDYHELYQSVRDEVTVCDYCASAYGVDDAVDAAGIERIGAYEGHPSIRSLVADEYEIITF